MADTAGPGSLAARLARLRHVEQIRFLVVGGFNTLLGFGIYFALVQAGVRFPVANFVSLIVGIGISFVMQGRLVFGNDDGRRFWVFVLCWFTIYLVQTGVIALGVQLGMTASFAGLIVLPGTAALSYVVNKLVVFRRSQEIR